MVDDVQVTTRWFAYIAWAAVLALALLLAEASGVNAWLLTRDPAQALEAPAWTGALSILGVGGWAFAAAACLTAAVVLRSVEPGTERVRFLLATGALMLYLGIDDALLLHEDVFPYRLGVPQKLVLALTAMVILAYALRFRRRLSSEDPLTVTLAALALAGSVLTDVFEVPSWPLEDACKLFGIGLLVYWCFDRARSALADALRPPDPRYDRQPAKASSVASKSVRATPPTAGDVTPAPR